MFKIKRNARSGRGAFVFFICLFFSVLMILLTSLIFAAIANSSNDPTKNLGIFSFAALLISAFAGGLFSAKVSKKDGVGYSLLVAMSVTLLMLLICIVAEKGKLSGGAFMNYGCYIGVFALSSLLGKSSGKRRRRR